MPADKLPQLYSHVLALALRRRWPLALVPQVVGASGRLYHLAIMVEPIGSGFLIALAAAPELNWYHNTLARDTVRCASMAVFII